MQERAFENPRQIGDRIDYVPGMVISIPDSVTHLLVRPLNRKGKSPRIFVTFFHVDYPGDFKPSSNTGKYFYRQNGATRCRINAALRPSGWNYEVEWLVE